MNIYALNTGYKVQSIQRLACCLIVCFKSGGRLASLTSHIKEKERGGEEGYKTEHKKEEEEGKGSHTLEPKGVAEDPPAWGSLGLGVSRPSCCCWPCACWKGEATAFSRAFHLTQPPELC